MMVKLILSIYDRLSKNKLLSIIIFMVAVVACALLSLHLHYQEDITAFLPQDKEKVGYSSVYDDMSNQGRITVIFSPKDSHGDKEEVAFMLEDALDSFEKMWHETDTGNLVKDLRCKVDDTPVFEAIDYMWENPPLFLNEQDYRRMDSLLAEPDYVSTCLTNVKRMLSFPTSDIMVKGVQNDPLNLYSPALKRLTSLNASNEYQVEDEYLFNNAGDKAFAFFTTPYDGNDTKRNAVLVDLIDQVIEKTQKVNPDVEISAIGAPIIAVSNARQIKRDSILSITLAIVLILVILLFTIGRKRNLLWLGVSVAFGWIFSLAVISIFKDSISIIVVGIGSVIVGIAVNYPLHYLDHIKHQTDKRAALKDMIQPLVIGNITTVAAFACLVFVKAEAMRDLGLFGALMLVGTILFVMVFLPLFAATSKGEKSKKSEPVMADGRFAAIKKYAFWPIVAITIVLACFSTGTTFDSDLHNINYMTDKQRDDLALLNQSVQGDDQMDLIYLISEDADFQNALCKNESIIANYKTAEPDSVHSSISGLDGILPSVERQRQSIEAWNRFKEAHSDLASQIETESVRIGLTRNAFSPFTDALARTYVPKPETDMQAIMSLCKPYILEHDTVYRIVDFVKVPKAASANINENMRTALPEGSFAFDESDVGNNLVTALSDDFNYILYVCGFVVFFFLLVSFGNLELSLLAFLPLTVSWFWILGLMDIASVKFNIVNIILATFIFGQGDDYTIFITEGLVHEYAYGKKLLKNYRNSVILSGVLMFIGIGTLIFAKHPAMKSLAEVAIIGMITVVFMACYLPPIIFNWLTKKKGVLRQVPITLKRLSYTFVMLLAFILTTFCFVTPLTLLYILLWPPDKNKRYRFHLMISSISRFAVKHIPGVRFAFDNAVGETFEKPAVIIANHQSHLDLLCMLFLNPKIVILTTDWVWKNPIYAVIIRFAEFYPVSDGYDTNLVRLKTLVDRGYSIVVFPEGTRSVTGDINRFHKGAFQLAKDLNLDIVPVFIHGVHDVMPKKDNILREGKISVEVGERVDVSRIVLSETRTVASQFHKFYVEHYAQICRQQNDMEYFAPYVKYRYLFKGREIEHESRLMVKRAVKLSETIERLVAGKESVLIKNSGQGELAFLLALSHNDVKVYAEESDEDKYMVASHCVGIPDNLSFFNGAASIQTDCSIDVSELLKI